MKGLGLADGYDYDLRPLTHTGPEQLIPVPDKPNILCCTEDLREAGIADIGVMLGNVIPETVWESIGGGAKFGVRRTYIVRREPTGIAPAVKCPKDFMGDNPLIVYIGDNLLKNGVEEERIGKSVVISRTHEGEDLLRIAREKGVIESELIDSHTVIASQAMFSYFKKENVKLRQQIGEPSHALRQDGVNARGNLMNWLIARIAVFNASMDSSLLLRELIQRTPITMLQWCSSMLNPTLVRGRGKWNG